ncbi:MAG: S1C family serine protease [Gemmatimonadales bacterium]
MPHRLAALAAGPIGSELSSLADALRLVTVRIRTGRSGEGAGVIWREHGVIVTNAHVALGAAVRIGLGDGRALDGRVVARDLERDLAAVVVADAHLPAASPGDVERLRAGELVVALGHPFGVANAISLGVVHQVVRDDDGTPRWIRADVRLAPGNSGGPLADATGRVLGLNTLVANGLGYAIPVPAITRFLRLAGLRDPGERAA